jgi:hypothetical protein
LSLHNLRNSLIPLNQPRGQHRNHRPAFLRVLQYFFEHPELDNQHQHRIENDVGDDEGDFEVFDVGDEVVGHLVQVLFDEVGYVLDALLEQQLLQQEFGVLDVVALGFGDVQVREHQRVGLFNNIV